MTPVSVSLNFMPAFYNKHLGIKYGEEYYFDPAYGAYVERSEELFLHESFGRYGMGSADPVPSGNFFIQPVDIIMGTQDAQWRFPEDGTVESWGTPWKGLSSADISAIDPREAAHHPVIDRILDHYKELKKLVGEKADLFWSKTGMMNIHTPYTTAHQLCGEELFITMLTDPESARMTFWKIWDIYEAIFARVTEVTGSCLTRVQLGDCSAALLSEKTYRDVVLPVNQEICAKFCGAGYHSCGPSSHLLTAFTELSNVDAVQLGPGTDIRSAQRLMPLKHIQPLIDPVAMKNLAPDGIANMVESIIIDAEGSPSTTLCTWALDRETPLVNVETLLRMVCETHIAAIPGKQ